MRVFQQGKGYSTYSFTINVPHLSELENGQNSSLQQQDIVHSLVCPVAMPGGKVNMACIPC